MGEISPFQFCVWFIFEYQKSLKPSFNPFFYIQNNLLNLCVDRQRLFHSKKKAGVKAFWYTNINPYFYVNRIELLFYNFFSDTVLNRGKLNSWIEKTALKHVSYSYIFFFVGPKKYRQFFIQRWKVISLTIFIYASLSRCSHLLSRFKNLFLIFVLCRILFCVAWIAMLFINPI